MMIIIIVIIVIVIVIMIIIVMIIIITITITITIFTIIIFIMMIAAAQMFVALLETFCLPGRRAHGPLWFHSHGDLRARWTAATCLRVLSIESVRRICSGRFGRFFMQLCQKKMKETHIIQAGKEAE